jgi:hypothetical protein
MEYLNRDYAATLAAAVQKWFRGLRFLEGRSAFIQINLLSHRWANISMEKPKEQQVDVVEYSVTVDLILVNDLYEKTRD